MVWGSASRGVFPVDQANVCPPGAAVNPERYFFFDADRAPVYQVATLSIYRHGVATRRPWAYLRRTMKDRNTTDDQELPEFCRRLEIARRQAGMTQEAVGEAAGYQGLSRAKMGRLLERRETEDIRRLRRIVVELRRRGVEVTADWLLGFGPRLASDPPPVEAPARPIIERRPA